MSAVILFLFIASGYVAIAITLCIVVIVAIQLLYLRTSRQLRILDIEAKAPLFSRFLEIWVVYPLDGPLAGQATTLNPSTTPPTCHKSHNICCGVSSDG